MTKNEVPDQIMNHVGHARYRTDGPEGFGALSTNQQFVIVCNNHTDTYSIVSPAMNKYDRHWWRIPMSSLPMNVKFKLPVFYTPNLGIPGFGGSAGLNSGCCYYAASLADCARSAPNLEIQSYPFHLRLDDDGDLKYSKDLYSTCYPGIQHVVWPDPDEVNSVFLNEGCYWNQLYNSIYMVVLREGKQVPEANPFFHYQNLGGRNPPTHISDTSTLCMWPWP